MVTRRLPALVAAGVALAGATVAATSPAAAVPAGLELRVNTFTSGSQLDPAVATDADGDFVVAWTSAGQDGSGGGVYAQRFHSNGDADGPELQVNTYTANSQAAPAVAMDADGDFVVVWQSASQDGWLWGVYGQRYDATGARVGNEFRVNTRTAREQLAPAVAVDDDGDFVVAWASYSQDGSQYGVFAQRYGADGLARGAELQVNTFTNGDQNAPAVAMDADGDFAVAWQSFTEGPGTGSNTYVRRYDASGVAQGDAVRTNTYTPADQGLPSIAMDAAGNIIVVWRSVGQDGSLAGVYGQGYDALGAPVGGEVQISTFTSKDQTFPSVAASSDGAVTVTWASDGQDGSGSGVYAQRFDATGALDGAEFAVNTFTAGIQTAPAVTADDGGSYVVAWQSADQDGSLEGVYAQRFVDAAPEVCDGDDNDRDGLVDEGVTSTFYADVDGDGHGDALETVEACAPPTGFVDSSDDGDDLDPTVYPGADELCDAKDNDQDGDVDEGWPDGDADGIVDCVDPDDDNDGIPDERDPDVVAAIITALPLTSASSDGVVSAMVARLDATENRILSDSPGGSVNDLRAMRMWVDGCDGSATEQADRNDKIVVCSDQHAVRDALDALIANLA